MATYEEIYGKRVKEFDSDPTLDSSYEGQVWYNTSTGTLRSVVSFAAYSTSTNLPSARSTNAQGGAVVTAGFSVGGTSMNNTDEYNGSGWFAGGNYPTPRSYLAGSGPETAAIAAGGNTYTNAANTYNGSTWTSITAMPTGSEACRAAGTSTATLIVEGGILPGPYPSSTYEWNGSSWTSGGSIPTSANYGANVAGTQTAAYSCGGNSPLKSATNNYDGSSWTTSGSAPKSIYNTHGNTVGTQTSGVITGGSGIAGPNFGAETFHYDGSVWAANVNSLQAYSNTGATWGTQNSHVFAGGSTPPATTLTQEYNVSTNTITAAAWASGGTLPITMRQNMSFGTQTAAINCGGYAPPGTKDDSLSYDGTSWTATPDLNAAARFGGVAGTQSAGLEFAGIQPDTTLSANVQSWNGSTWSNNPYNVSTGTYGNMGCGTQTAALKIGGAAPGSPSIYTTTEEYDGEGWTAGGTMPQGRYGGGGNGTQTSCVFAGGQDATGPSSTSCVEYDGTSWTAGGSLNSSRGSGAMGAGASSDSALVFGGAPAQSFNEGYDGTAFSTRPSLATGRGFSGGNGIATSALIVAGGPPSGTTTNVEEFTGETETTTAQTLTTS